MLEGRDGDRPLKVAIVNNKPDTTQLLFHGCPSTVMLEKCESVECQDVSVSHIIDKGVKLDKHFVIPSSWVSRGDAENLSPVVAREVESPG